MDIRRYILVVSVNTLDQKYLKGGGEDKGKVIFYTHQLGLTASVLH
jgi:hypothetical protein